MKKGKYLILILIMLSLSFWKVPAVRANPGITITQTQIYSYLRGGVYLTDPEPVYLKNATVELDCYENLVQGSGSYCIVNLDSTTKNITIYFMHFLWNLDSHSTITSIKVNGIEELFSLWAGRDVAFFNTELTSNQIIDLDITWEYVPDVKGHLLLGYSIFAEGWNKPIEYESVEFRFHSDQYYKNNKIALYSADYNYGPRFDDDYSNIQLHNKFIDLSKYCKATKLTSKGSYKSFEYKGENISKNHFLIITDPRIELLTPLEWVVFITVSFAGFSISMVIGINISKKYVLKKSIERKILKDEGG